MFKEFIHHEVHTLQCSLFMNRMGIMKLMILNSSRGSIHKYENLLSKLYKCDTNICFNKQCLKKQLTPSYANIKVPNTSPAYKHTQKKLPTIRLKDKIGYLYSKKQQINLQLYQLHLTLANTCGSWWPHIKHTIEEKLCKDINSKYKTLDRKLQNLTLAQKETHVASGDFNFAKRPFILSYALRCKVRAHVCVCVCVIRHRK